MMNLIILSLFIISLAIIIFINSKYKRTNFYKNQIFDVEKFVRLSSCIQADTKFDVINVGSTQPCFAFDYTGMTITGMNWAVRPQTLEFDLLILRSYHSFLKEGAVVLIPVCPFEFFAYRCFNLIKYYGCLSPSLIYDYSHWRKLLYIDYPILTARRNLKRLIKDVMPDTRFEITNNPMDDDQMAKDAKRWVDIWLNQFAFDQMTTILLSQENESNIQKNIILLNEMITFCLEQNYRPVIMTLPASKELTALIPQSFINEYVQGNIKKANTQGVPVLNYWGDTRFMDAKYFLNAFFFNLSGRIKFTRKVIEELSKVYS
jgi:hypothetical protein